MHPSERPEIGVEALLALRQEHDAIRLITERLRVKEMGPADHIRTKHEVKSFVASGDALAAEALVNRARQRRVVNQRVSLKIVPRQGQRLTE